MNDEGADDIMAVGTAVVMVSALINGTDESTPKKKEVVLNEGAGEERVSEGERK